MTDELKQWAEDKAADSARVKVLKEVYSEIERFLGEYKSDEDIDKYEDFYNIGVQTGLLIALVVIGNKSLDIEGVPR